MPVFARTSPIPATPGELFRFHENPHNIRLISPPGLRVLTVESEPTARPGQEFRVVVRQGPLTTDWLGRWETVAEPGLLVDTAVRSPFAFWRHRHEFAACEAGSLLTDRVEFRLPWRRGGPVADQLALRLVLPAMFRQRHRATRAFFAKSPA